MENNERVINRNDLYEMVWRTPMIKLASRYGISDVMLKKICKQLNVPTPTRGYWAKVQNGQKIAKSPLPRKKIGQPGSYYIQKRDLATKEQKEEHIKISDETIGFISASITNKSIKVPMSLASPYPLIVRTRKTLSNTKVNKYGILPNWKSGNLDIRVSPKMVNRALRIFNTIIRFFSKEHIEVVGTTSDNNRSTHVEIFNEKVRFLIREPSRQYQHQLTKKEKEDIKKYGRVYAPKYDFYPSGKLILEIKDYWSPGINKKWSDGQNQQVEDCLKEFFTNIFMIADIRRTNQIKRNEEEKRLAEERARIAELERQKELEKQRLNDLEKDAEQWTKSKVLRNYINGVVKAATQQGFSIESNPDFNKWIIWATEHADRLDPLANGLPFTDLPDKT